MNKQEEIREEMTCYYDKVFTPYREITKDGTEITVTFPCWKCAPKGLHCWYSCKNFNGWFQ